MRRTITEKFDEQGHVIERVTVEEDVTPVVIGPVRPNGAMPYIFNPNDVTPYVYPGNTWQSPTGIGGCAACSRSGICNCILGGTQMTCSVN